MANKLIDYREHDKNFWYEELEEWVPKRIYDCHIHMLNNSLIDDSSEHKNVFPDADLEGLRGWHNTVFPNRDVNNLFLGRPALGTRINEYNDFLYKQINGNPLTRAHRLTTPSDSLEDIESDIKNKGFQGLKVYRMYSVTGDMANCTIEEFLPHEQLELANELGLWVTLHMSREDGCGDEKNLKDLTEFTTKRFPNIKWILAHIARSFAYRPIQRGIGHAHQQVETDNIPSLTFSHTTNRPLICIYEQLIAMKQASIICELDKNQLEDIFWRNAVREFNVPWN